MAAPAFVGAGTGQLVTTGTQTVSKTGCTVGNLILGHMFVRGTTDDWSDSNVVNINRLNGTAGFTDLRVSFGWLKLGRVAANGTCSIDVTVGGSSEDILCRLYEFSGVSTGTTLAEVVENGADPNFIDGVSATSTTVMDAPVVTNGNDRLALSCVEIALNVTTADFTGETGGDWAEAATFSSASGLTGTLQLQTAAIPSATTIDGGEYTITSASWQTLGFALIPAVIGTPSRTYKRLYGPAQLSGSAADLYTCPASTVARTLHIHASNPSGSPVDVNLSIGTDAAGTRVWDDLAIPADGVKDVFDPYELAAGEKIQGWADTAGAVVVTITGHEDAV